MASNLERARAMLSGKAPLPLNRTAVSVFQPLESETVKHAKNRGLLAFHGVAGETALIAGKAAYVSPETSSETLSETLKQGLPVALPDDEREAIMLCGGMPSRWAKVFSTFDADRPPQGLSARHWQDRLDAILVFADRNARDLERLGWDAEALFAIGEYWQQLRLRGVGWFIAEDLASGGMVVEVNAHTIVYQTHRGARRTILNDALA